MKEGKAGNGRTESETVSKLQQAASDLRGIANAIGELEEQVAPGLPNGKRELFTVICEGLYTKTHDTSFFIGTIANDISKSEVR